MHVADGRHVVVELEPLARAAEPVHMGAPDAQDACERLVDLLPVDRQVRYYGLDKLPNGWLHSARRRAYSGPFAPTP